MGGLPSELMMLWEDMAHVFEAVGEPPARGARPFDDDTVALARAFHKHAPAYSQLAGGLAALTIEDRWEEQVAPLEEELPWVPEARHRRNLAAALVVNRRSVSSVQRDTLDAETAASLTETKRLLSQEAA